MLLLILALLHGSTILLLDQHDYVYPVLSPDGTKLAVARVMERPDGYETTEVLLVDLATGAMRELLSREEAERHDVYESWVLAMRWLDDRRVVVSLSDGDVGGSDLTVDIERGLIASTDSEEDAIVPAELSDVAANAYRYARWFSKEELELSLGSAIRLPSDRVLIQRRIVPSRMQSVFLITPRTHAVRRITRVRSGFAVAGAIEWGDEIIFLMKGEKRAMVMSARADGVRTLASWAIDLKGACSELREIAPRRLFVFVRPCVTNEPASAKLFEIAGGRALPRSLGDHVDRFSVSADGSRIAIAFWQDGRRHVRVLDRWKFE